LISSENLQFGNCRHKSTVPTSHLIANPIDDFLLQVPRKNEYIVRSVGKDMVLMENGDTNARDIFALFERCRVNRVWQQVGTDATVVQENGGLSRGAVAAYRFTS